MKYLNALFVAMHRRQPLNPYRSIGVLSLMLFLNLLAAVLLLPCAWGHFTLHRLVFLSFYLGPFALLTYRYRWSGSFFYLDKTDLPAATLWHVWGYFLLSALLVFSAGALGQRLGC
ncbi:hypothetical protein [Hymenobacter edaphi]|uniref:Uncharacterized protein n=1 Tax=Hymenobacter edaphi TaxID=2211146 RepID=A0A328BKU6_9BACT|nr:hypothetical protein [Hymenobacter edaphi]RAK67051.1 hypothetical protein DLM85_12705 [Hymenobacter edaphi]